VISAMARTAASTSSIRASTSSTNSTGDSSRAPIRSAASGTDRNAGRLPRSERAAAAARSITMGGVDSLRHMPKVVVLNPHPFYQPYTLERAAAERLGASFHADGPPDDDLLASTTVLLTHQAPIDRAMLDRLPTCRLIVSYSTGVDHMDLQAAAERGVIARGIAGYCTVDVAEHALAMILSCARRLHQLDRAMRDRGEWDVTVRAPGRRRLSTQTLGLVGVGRIGGALASRAAGLGMRVLGCDPYVAESSPDLTLLDLDALLAQSDYVSLHAPLTPETHHVIDARALALMKPTAFLINCARGALVDEAALQHALSKRQIAGAALDVREQEPVHAGDPIVCRDDVLSTPHAGAFTDDALADLRDMVIGYMQEVLVP
jgi:D-3-phosphoglycerate dehydrogenase / 2-oxoglutarate reductase